MTRFLSFLALVAAITTCRTDLAIASTLDLVVFLQAAADADRPTVTLRVDGEIMTDNPEHPLRDQIIVLHRPNNDVFVELHTTGVKLIILKGGGEAYLLSEDEQTVRARPLSASISGTDFTLADFHPFAVTDYASPTVIDATDRQLTVQFDPRRPYYSLVVMTFDRKKHARTKTLYYQQTLNNLVKMRRDEHYRPIAGQWRPTTISVHDFPLRTTSRLTLRWSDLPMHRRTYSSPSPSVLHRA